ncbi:MAG TPA: methyltransferase domain-containing protein [Persephonella sp.]|uniref:Ubiquinone/menaquinone biosynthesis methyltransferase UbiE n=1 Tax=Persephonella marina (strain DSM 14350 / EX-H1) TaxID=123214 RepID=C0QQ48_PERMH|nr:MULTISPECIES: ubiquinone/menaquinone biosynthesis methyltransferase [Persephonella]ACO03911.1 ubiquinone/menaquinone biosynthesis methyltransferase UbiE [Persephonella marina EX-H1]HCB69591.1 methyltransferase domain-containing protein [Persephonella sp.]
MGDRKEISQLFNRISDRYEIVNHILSFGLDILWRRKACKKVYELNGNEKVNIFLDVATGTGEIIKHCRNSLTERFVGLDPAIRMLEFAKNTTKNAFFINAAAEEIPLKDNSTDIIFVAFGVRNMEDRKKAFSEFHRVLKDGKYLVILEFIHREDGGFLYRLSHFYIQKILPYIGGMITGDFKAYRYLADSIDHFITAGMLKEEIEGFGFKIEYIENLFPTVSIIIGRNEKD